MTVDRALIAIIDSDDFLRARLRILLGAAGLKSELFKSAEEYLKRSESHSPNCIVLDVRLPGIGGLDLQSRLARTRCKTPLVFLTAQNEVRMSVRAMKAGAIDYLIKPFQDDTARVHSSRIMSKMGARSIADLVRMVDKLGHVPREGAIRSKDVGVTNCYRAAHQHSNARTSEGSSTEVRRGRPLSPAPALC